MIRTFAVTALLVVASLQLGTAAPKKGATYTDPQEAGIDFKIQGEYVGEYTDSEGETEKFGVQVIALGDGKFRAVGYEGGLPGAGWEGDEKEVAEGELEDGKVVFKNDEGTAILDVEASMMAIYAPDSEKKIGSAKKTLRKSPTLGMAPPENAVVLFNGETAENWRGGKMTDDNLLQVGVLSKQAFKDFTLHMEFRLPFMPKARGQGRGNSGVYLQNRYECQILDSFGLEGKNNECGGFYKFREPNVNMCLPPLSWQTYDIELKAARFDDSGKKVSPAVVTVRHNGVIIHENFELPDRTAGGKPESAEPGPIQLQNHGNPVHFRNIWVVEK